MPYVRTPRTGTATPTHRTPYRTGAHPAAPRPGHALTSPPSRQVVGSASRGVATPVARQTGPHTLPDTPRRIGRARATRRHRGRQFGVRGDSRHTRDAIDGRSNTEHPRKRPSACSPWPCRLRPRRTDGAHSQRNSIFRVLISHRTTAVRAGTLRGVVSASGRAPQSLALTPLRSPCLRKRSPRTPARCTKRARAAPPSPCVHRRGRTPRVAAK